MRALASVQKIISVRPVVNSNNLDVVQILGWRVVVTRNSFVVGDLCVYFEVDSILPEREEFEFLRKYNFTLTTVRLRGQLSQGLAWSTDILKGVPQCDIVEGLDVTEHLGIKLYEEYFPEEMVGKSKGFRPTHTTKAGESRVQTYPALLEEFKGLKVAETTKIDGVSAEYCLNNNEYDVCCHTHSLLEDMNSVYWQMEYKYSILSKLKKYGNISIQGEIAGYGINGNPLCLPDVQLFVFRVTLLDENRRLTPKELCDFCRENGLQPVPMKLDVPFDYSSVDEVLEAIKGVYPNTDVPREGVVYVPMTPVYSETLCNWLSMKVINNDYLLGEWKKNRKGC